MVTKRRSTAHLPVAGPQPRGEPGAAVCTWPFTGDHSGPSPRLPPSHFIGTHVTDEDHGALVTTPADVNPGARGGKAAVADRRWECPPRAVSLASRIASGRYAGPAKAKPTTSETASMAVRSAKVSVKR
jgi:hypothetical protein